MEYYKSGEWNICLDLTNLQISQNLLLVHVQNLDHKTPLSGSYKDNLHEVQSILETRR